MEEMVEEYQMCITELIETGIPAGEVHDVMETTVKILVGIEE